MMMMMLLYVSLNRLAFLHDEIIQLDDSEKRNLATHTKVNED